jgi:tricorn protease
MGFTVSWSRKTEKIVITDFMSKPALQEPRSTPKVYINFSCLSKNWLFFVSGQGLWKVSREGGGRLSQVGAPQLVAQDFSFLSPVISPDEEWIIFSGRTDLYRIRTIGGDLQRLTFLDEFIQGLCFDSQGFLICTTAFGSPFRRDAHFFRMSMEAPREIDPLHYGPGNFISYNPSGGKVIQRLGCGYAAWRQYQGGTAGQIWVETSKAGETDKAGQRLQEGDDLVPFKKLEMGPWNVLTPFWIQDRIYFLSDQSGVGNIHSCLPDGSDLKQHTFHKDYYARHLSCNGTDLSYVSGGEVWLFSALHDRSEKVELSIPQLFSKELRVPKKAYENLTSYSIQGQGKRVVLTDRGRIFSTSPGKGPTLQHGQRDGVRYRLAHWLNNQEFLVLRDDGLDEKIEVYNGDFSEPLEVFSEKDIQKVSSIQKESSQEKKGGDHESEGFTWGRILEVLPSPKEQDKIVCGTNHRNELFILDLKNKTGQVIAQSPKGPLLGFDWSPDGQWIVYSMSLGQQISKICLYSLERGDVTHVTSGMFKDFSPCFDPQGRFIYFLSSRSFDPSWDHMRFHLNFFPKSKPYVVSLSKEAVSPFVGPVVPSSLGGHDKEEEKSTPGEVIEGEGVTSLPGQLKEEGPNKDHDVSGTKEEPLKNINIHLEGLQERIQEFPVAHRDYSHVLGIGQKVLFVSWPQEDHEEKRGKEHCGDCKGGGVIHCYDLSTLKEDQVLSGVISVSLSIQKTWMAGVIGGMIRVMEAGASPDDQDASFKDGGWIRPNKLSLFVSPHKEWVHMFDEAWRLQKELFWRKDMGSVDWDQVYSRYRPLVDRISTLGELYGIISEMQGELGTSHAYIYKGEAGKTKSSSLGVETVYSEKEDGYLITKIHGGDLWDPENSSPFKAMGVNLSPGDYILAVGGRRLGKNFSFQQALIEEKNDFLWLKIQEGKTRKERLVVVSVQGGGGGTETVYRDWVEKNRKLVLEHTQNRVGYIHIPDMGPEGFGEFLRGYMPSYDKDGLVVDLRYNGGGNVSPLILDYLTRKRLGYDYSRWQGTFPYPEESPKGPMVFIANEHTGSDGDIFCQAVKSLKLGPLIGQRTWGGVVGIWPRYSLLDGTMTTQPEYSFWFHDVGWSIENKGVEPDVEVPIAPEDYRAGRDTQLEKALELIQGMITNHDKKPVL